MKSTSTFSALRSTLPRFARVFTEAQARHTCLAACPSVVALGAALPLDRQATTDDVRHALITAFLAEAATGNPLWSTLLLLEYEPTIRGLARRATDLPRDEREQAVIATFLEVVRAASTRGTLRNARAYLHQATQFARMHERVRGLDRPEMVPLDEDIVVRDGRDVFVSELERRCGAREILDRVLEDTPASEIEAIADSWSVGSTLASAVVDDPKTSPLSRPQRQSATDHVRYTRDNLAIKARALLARRGRIPGAT
jgi:hypothetical protein